MLGLIKLAFGGAKVASKGVKKIKKVRAATKKRKPVTNVKARESIKQGKDLKRAANRRVGNSNKRAVERMAREGDKLIRRGRARLKK